MRPDRARWGLAAIVSSALFAGCTGGSPLAPPGNTGLSTAVSAQKSHFAEYPIPTANAGASSIVLGPDRALWFTEPGGYPGYSVNAIGRITTAGAITGYPVPTKASAVFDITAGTDR